VSLPSSAPSERYGCPRCLSVFRAGFARCPLDGAALQGLSGDPLIGHTLADRYIIEELLGEGGMGRVYRARHNRMSRRFAVKVLFGDMAADAKARTRFSREAEAVSRLNHPNVLSVVDFGETEEGLLYLVMDFIEGRELHQVLAQEAPLSPTRALSLLRQLSRGLAHAHERNLVHRDFKTENVVVTKSGDEELAHIVDFGIAAVGEMMEPAQRLTTEGMVLGTPAYMSPEQSTGEEVDERSDLFSLGVMLYEMLCGRLPFDGSAVAIAKAHLAAEVPAVAVRVPGLRVDSRLEAVAMRLMAKDPEERFQSARSLLAHLDSAFGRADSQEGEDHDATVQVSSSGRMPMPVPLPPPTPSGEQPPIEPYRYTPYEMAAIATASPGMRMRDPRWVITGAAVLLTLVVVVIALAARGGRTSPSARLAPPVQAAEPRPTPTAPEAAPPVAPAPAPMASAAAPVASAPLPSTSSAPAPSTSSASGPASTAAPEPVPIAPAQPAAAADEPGDARDKAGEAEADRDSSADEHERRPGKEKRSRSARRSSESRSGSRHSGSKSRGDEPSASKPEPPPAPAPASAAAASATKPAEQPTAAAATPAAQPSEPVVPYKEFIARYRAVGERIDRIIAKRGEAAVGKLQQRYSEIAVQDAARSESLRRDYDRALRTISARLDKQFSDIK